MRFLLLLHRRATSRKRSGNCRRSSGRAASWQSLNLTQKTISYSFPNKKIQRSVLRVLSSARVGIQLKTKLKITNFLFATALMLWRKRIVILFLAFSLDFPADYFSLLRDLRLLYSFSSLFFISLQLYVRWRFYLRLYNTCMYK